MSRKNYLLLISFLSIGALQAQVGINTDNPLTDLHVVGDSYITGITKIGGNTTFNTSAQLELGDSDKGFLANRVALTDPSVKAPIVNAEPGMLVYNVTESAILREGYYFWNGSNWEAFVTEIPPNPVSGFDLLLDIASKPTSPSASEGGTYLSLGDKTTTVPINHNYFEIDQPGSYAFGLRVYGSGNLKGTNTAGRSCVYFTLMVNGVKTDVQEVNWALVDPVAAGAGNKIGGTVVLTGNTLKKGDKIEFILAHYNAAWSEYVTLQSNPGLKANKTSLVFWRL